MAFILNFFDVVICLAIAGGYIAHLSGMDIILYGISERTFGSGFAELLYTVYDSFNKVILPLGVVSTSLLLPFKDYVTDIEDTMNDSIPQDEETANGPGESMSHDCDLTRSSSFKATHHVSLPIDSVEMRPVTDTNANECTPLMDNEHEKHYNNFSETCTQSVGVYEPLI